MVSFTVKKGGVMVYSTKKYSHLQEGASNLVIDSPRLKVQYNGKVYATVTYLRDVDLEPITFNIRYSMIKEAITKPENQWYSRAEGVYSVWINNTITGQRYTAFRWAEGMLKTAIKRGDEDMVELMEKVLKMSDDRIMAFRDEWFEAHTDSEISDWYDYDDTEVW